MTFLSPEMLFLLLLVPALVAAYIMLLRRRAKYALRYASLITVKEAVSASQRIRRHIPPLLFLLALVLIFTAVARPTTTLTLPSNGGTVVLAVDLSTSMRATDVAPSRLDAAKAAVRSFVAQQPSTTRVGLVTFANTASLVQPPTSNREAILSALDMLQLQGGTAVGSAILISLKTIFPDIQFELRSSNPRPRPDRHGVSLDKASGPPSGIQPQPVPPGSYDAAAIILLSDGKSTTGPDAIEAAMMAAERGVRIYTVGIGTPGGEIIVGDGWVMKVRLDEASLKRIAKETKGEYFYADNAMDLTNVYNTLNSRLTLETKPTEVSALFAAGAALLALLSAGLSLCWSGRLP